MLPRSSACLGVLLLLAGAACSGARSPSPAGARPPEAEAPGRSSSRLGAQEIRTATQPDAFLLVQALRPTWLRKRGTGTITGREVIKVYRDGVLIGGPEALRQVTTNSIESLEFLDGITATQRWGLDHGNGAIVVTTRRR